jgi:hypothetical protein
MAFGYPGLNPDEKVSFCWQTNHFGRDDLMAFFFIILFNVADHVLINLWFCWA